MTFKSMISLSMNTVVALSCSQALAIDPAQCPRVIELRLSGMQARVHSSFIRDADYRAAVEELNRLGSPQIKYALAGSNGDSCDYTADAGGALDGRAALYSKEVYDPELNEAVKVDMLRSSFWPQGIRALFALSLVVESYGPAELNAGSGERTLLALLTKNGRKSYRRSGKTSYTVQGSR